MPFLFQIFTRSTSPTSSRFSAIRSKRSRAADCSVTRPGRISGSATDDAKISVVARASAMASSVAACLLK